MGQHAALSAPRAGAPPLDRAAAETARALAAVVLIAVAPSGTAGAAALARAVAVCTGSPAFAGLDGGDVEALARLVLRSLAVRGPGAVMADVQGLIPPGMAETAIALALRACRPDGRMAPGTMDRIGALAARLGVCPDRLALLVEALAILDRAPG